MALTDLMNEAFASNGIFFESVYMDPLKSKQSRVLVTARVLWRGTSSIADVQNKLYIALKPYASEFDHVIKASIHDPVHFLGIPENANDHCRQRMENRRVRYSEYSDAGLIKFSPSFVWNVQDVS
ncbi:hypothetical protein EQVG_00359 [Emiliania huxleyi virus 207]|nr:hypothetical protein ELVG_00310 [Emiliania huxleyi virus 203]AEP15768.1 hypothetical protein EQVG_00359 [Emiliania huxleyi virus 207]AEP16175.1 hypothetical protein ERVG_00300 [Emiliania huxleyi virus 208]